MFGRRLPGRYGEELFGSIENLSPDWRSIDFLSHNAIKVTITEQDIDAAMEGKMVRKVIHIPEDGVIGPPGHGRESVLAILRLGNWVPVRRQ